MDYTSIHIYGHLLSDDILHQIETDNSMLGNRPFDFGLEGPVTSAIDHAWVSLRNDWQLFGQRSSIRDVYGTSFIRKIMTRFMESLDYTLDFQSSQVKVGEVSFDIPYFANGLGNMPIIIVGDRTGDAEIDTLDKSSLDYRAKGSRSQKSPHATMLDYLNSTDLVYGIITNGLTLRIIRNTGQLVKLTYIEFDIRRMVEEDHYAEFALMFRLLHASRFVRKMEEPSIIESWFNLSVESGNRIRAGLSDAVQKAMEILGQAALTGNGEGNRILREAVVSRKVGALTINKELIHFIYRLLFLFIIEDRNLVYQLPEYHNSEYEKLLRCQEIYNLYYSASRLRPLSELRHLRDSRYNDLWESLMDTFRLYVDEDFGSRLGIKPLGGVLFSDKTLSWLEKCTINNKDLLEAFGALNEFIDDKGNRVKINYSSLDVEEFGSVYEGILEMRPVILQDNIPSKWRYTYGEGSERKSTNSYYTRPDLVQSIVRSTFVPVIEQKLSKAQSKEEKIDALLSLKFCDAASGSGHIVLAMARILAWYLSTIRTGEDNPASLDYREALRDVIQNCVYAVDFNPDAVELCKVVLWIEGYCAGKPLSFLDAHIRCGNSVVGVTDLNMLLEGVPKDAFDSSNKDVKKRIVSMNAEALKSVKEMLGKGSQGGWYASSIFDTGFSLNRIGEEQISLATSIRSIMSLSETTLDEKIEKQKRWEELMSSPRVEKLRLACDIYTYAYYKQFSDDDDLEDVGRIPQIPYTRTVYQALEEIKAIDDPGYEHVPLSDEFKAEVETASKDYRFFHWAIEFPEVFSTGGFDVMCGNPPWDKIKVEDKKWFEKQGRADIVNAGTAAQRKNAISHLEVSDPLLFESYKKALSDAESLSRFVRFSGRFPLTATGDIDYYPLFAEHYLNSSKRAWGMVLPTGIAINDSNKGFFSKLIDENRLISLYDFENREKLFDIDSRFKFCLLTAGAKQPSSRKVSGGFYLTCLDHLLDPNRIYNIATQDFALINPNTKTCPVFRTAKDAELTAKMYRNSTILLNDTSGSNPWEVRFMRHFDMSNDSNFFKTYQQLQEKGARLEGNHFWLDGEEYVPLYEGKMFWLYNHHFGTWPTEGERPNAIESPSADELQNPDSNLMPWYWVPKNESDERLIKRDKRGNIIWRWSHPWLICFRAITNATNERTFIASAIPDSDAQGVGVGNSATLLLEECGTMPGALLLGMISSLPFDYATRQKVGGMNMSISFVKQFPVLTPEQIHDSGWEQGIVERVARLVWFNHDMDPWMEELRQECPDDWDLPQEVVCWDECKRAVWHAELDAIFAHLYGLTTEELRYILDPEDVYGPGCINETFRVLKDREIREFGEYRTKRLVLEAWERFNFGN